MQFSIAASHHPDPLQPDIPVPPALRWGTITICAVLLAGCASQPLRTAEGPGGGRYFDPILGVWASPRVIGDGQAVPRGGGGYLVGRPYTIGGRTFVPNGNPQGYAVVGTASWYGDAFHGRRTANGEVFDKGSISAAHPTLPLPSYVRVTNLKNNRSMIVRVNDRGPYHGGRVMDVSQRVAEALAFRNEGTARIRVEYVGRASLAGSDDGKLLASLRTDGGAARLDGMTEPPQVADEAVPASPDAPSPLPVLPRVASLPAFRRGHIVTRTEEPVERVVVPEPSPVAPTREPAAPPSVPSVRSRTGLPPRVHRGPPARDPYYRPLFAPPSEPKPTVSFSVPARRPARPPVGDAARGATGGDDTR